MLSIIVLPGIAGGLGWFSCFILAIKSDNERFNFQPKRLKVQTEVGYWHRILAVGNLPVYSLVPVCFWFVVCVICFSLGVLVGSGVFCLYMWVVVVFYSWFCLRDGILHSCCTFLLGGVLAPLFLWLLFPGKLFVVLLFWVIFARCWSPWVLVCCVVLLLVLVCL